MEDDDGLTSELFIAVGEQLKVLRVRAGLTQKEFGRIVGYTESQISAMERGVRITQPDFLDKADDVLNAGGVLRAARKAIESVQARGRVRHPGWYRNYAMVEAEAIELHHYGTQAVHGLLQTEAYARALFTQRRPLLSDETIEKRVADRLARQEVLHAWPSPTFSFVFQEVVLQHPIGGRTVWREQLQQLLRIAQMRTVELQIMPTDREDCPGIDGPFNLLTTKKGQQLAYTEIQGHPRLITDPEEVRVIITRYGIIRAQALTPRESLALIEKMLGDA